MNFGTLKERNDLSDEGGAGVSLGYWGAQKSSLSTRMKGWVKVARAVRKLFVVMK